MAQQFLNRAQICACAQQMRGKEWRSAWGVAVSGRPSMPRMSHRFWTAD
jgi:hypothetical protein